jgi:hypothetical protein
MQIHITNNGKYPGAEPLACPSCHKECLHQYIVATLRLTEVSTRDTIVTEAVRDENDHGRRHGCFIHFWCESCARNPVLRIMQHKGSTFLEWMPERFDRSRP